MDLGEFDSSGRKRPVPIDDQKYTVEVDTVICAIGQKPDLSFVSKGQKMSIERGGTIKVTEQYRTRLNNSGEFAGGDVVTGPDTVVAAIRAGQDAAREIDEYIRNISGEPPYVEPLEERIEIPVDIDEETVETPSFDRKHLAASKRRKNFKEVDKGFTHENAKAEAGRCLRCDLEID